MSLFPRKIVVILNAANDFRTEQLRDEAMDHSVVRGRVLAHQVHRGPVLLTRLAIQTQPRETPQVLIPSRQRSLRNRTVRATNGCPRAATSAVAEQPHVFASL